MKRYIKSAVTDPSEESYDVRMDLLENPRINNNIKSNVSDTLIKDGAQQDIVLDFEYSEPLDYNSDPISWKLLPKFIKLFDRVLTKYGNSIRDKEDVALYTCGTEIIDNTWYEYFQLTVPTKGLNYDTQQEAISKELISGMKRFKGISSEGMDIRFDIY